MCGIVGINRNDSKLIRKMTESLAHRGPDKDGYYTDSMISLGHRRLSIIDLSENATQPMSNENDALQIVFNGEIYNFRELREQFLKRHIFRSNSDTEVIVHMYEEFGQECVKYFNGMFAFAIWDSKQKSLFLARDRLGIKPLYYYFKNSTFIFGSEIKAILSCEEVKREVDANSLEKLLTLAYLPDESTMFKSIQQVKPGHYVVLQNGKVHSKQYWDVHFARVEQPENYYQQQIMKTLTESVKRRLVSDVPLGAFLSGGLDSSAIVGIMSGLTDTPVKTFSVGYNEPTDELKDARVISEHFGTDHTELIVEPESLNILPELIYHMDEPMADPVVLPTFLMSRLARKHVTVVLSGEGGDELFGGYSWYRRALQTELLRKICPPPVRKVSALLARFPMDRYNQGKIKRRLEFLSILGNKAKTNVFFNNVFNRQEKQELFPTKTGTDFTEEQNKAFFPKGTPYINQVYYYYLKTYLPGQILTKTDRMSMAHALEVRVPFLDHTMVELAATIPFSLKARGKQTKYILRKTLRNLLPESSIKKPKQGFAVPLNSWFGRELKDIAQKLLSESATHQSFLNYGFAHKLISSGKITDKHLKFDKIWNLLCFEIWHRMYIESDLFKKKKVNLTDLM